MFRIVLPLITNIPHRFDKEKCRLIPFFLLFIFLNSFLVISNIRAQSIERYAFSSNHMGTTFKIIFYAYDDSTAKAASDASFLKVQKLNQILSDYEYDSELNKLSRSSSGHSSWVPVSRPLFRVLSKAQVISQKTDGAFDITIGPFVQTWRKMNADPDPSLPSVKTIKKLSESVGFEYLKIDSSRQAVKLIRQNMQLDAGGIAKGFAADEVLKVLNSYGIKAALVDAGGDIVLGEAPPGKKGWKISILYHTKNGETQTMTLNLANRAIATSGDLYRHIDIGNKRYSHIIDPATGLGLTNQCLVTVIAPDGITADSYASAINVLGPEKGLSLIENDSLLSGFIEFKESEIVKKRYSSSFKSLQKK